MSLGTHRYTLCFEINARVLNTVDFFVLKWKDMILIPKQVEDLEGIKDLEEFFFKTNKIILFHKNHNLFNILYRFLEYSAFSYNKIKITIK